jgi:alcohol dehydrogenase (cytochrome c)
MKKLAQVFLAILASLVPLAARAQALDPATLAKPSVNSWPTYSGDYSGRHYSPLDQINQSNVRNLALAWVGRVTAGTAAPDDGGFGLVRNTTPLIVGGEATEDIKISGPNGTSKIVGAILQVNGVLYLSTPDNAWAMDARDGRVIWHFVWKTKGGIHIGNRGMAIYGDWLFFETPDDYLVSLDAKTGKERWHKVIADFNQQYFSTVAPIVAGDHLLIGTGNDMDAPGFLKSVDPRTGDDQWTLWTTPHEKTDPGAETWSTMDAARHGGGNAWVPGSYDPELHLYYVGTGNPNPIFSSGSRAGDNLFTCSILAVNVDTGKMVWYFQATPHETHDWDAAQTPVLVDADFGGKPRKLLLTANRSGYFFVLDRLTGQHLLTAPFSSSANWATGVNDKGQPIRNLDKDPQIGGALVSPSNPGITNWPPPTYNPDTGLFYVQRNESYSEYYITDPDPNEAQGFGGAQEQLLGSLGRYLTAIDYKTGKVMWQHPYPNSLNPGGGAAGLLSTGGKLLFAPDAAGNLIAYDPANGNILWHTHLGPVSNAPETYLLDGRQYILVAAGDSVYSFALN